MIVDAFFGGVNLFFQYQAHFFTGRGVRFLIGHSGFQTQVWQRFPLMIALYQVARTVGSRTHLTRVWSPRRLPRNMRPLT